MADNTYVTICQEVVPVTAASEVGFVVPSGQLCEEEQGRQVAGENCSAERACALVLARKVRENEQVQLHATM